MTDSREPYRLMCRTVEALTLGFDEKIRYDYTMPDTRRIVECVVHAFDELFPIGDGGKRISYMQGRPLYDVKKVEMEPRVREGLALTLDEDYDHDPELGRVMRNNEHIWRGEWFFGKGTLYAFRDGEREKACKKVHDYFSSAELAEFERLYVPMREHAKTLWK